MHNSQNSASSKASFASTVLAQAILLTIPATFLILFLTTTTVENYLFKIMINSIITFLVTYIMYVYELVKDQTLVLNHKKHKTP